ncbi:GTP-binding protein [archaeon]|jgi:uncharacterized protein|nr:GTP-binding protein [archaeon]MBT3730804.1 GTP-binding protein [archaeon]MBT4670118.1 GTP-binding protein [archaeon]MBT5030581.1 GTP-binding protein [archaeon]MBT5287934.1 GTP-binding protein [archaeon]
MVMPHQVQFKIIKKRLKGLEGKAKLKEIEEIRQELPGFNTGPYGEMKSWLTDEVKKTKTRSNIKHQDWLGVKRQGKKQFVLVGCPSVGKSSLIQKLSGIQIKVAAYEFTTLKPQPAVINLKGADIQIVDLPGLLKGAVDDIGGGKRLIGIVRNADGIIFMHDLSKPLSDMQKIMDEIDKAKIKKPKIILGNKVDLARDNFRELKEKFSKDKVIAISTETEEGFNELKEEIWNLSNLIRVFTVHDRKPFILAKDSRVSDLLQKIHREFLEKFKVARVTGKSAKFPRQSVGINHYLEDEDEIQIILKK